MLEPLLFWGGKQPKGHLCSCSEASCPLLCCQTSTLDLKASVRKSCFSVWLYGTERIHLYKSNCTESALMTELFLLCICCPRACRGRAVRTGGLRIPILCGCRAAQGPAEGGAGGGIIPPGTLRWDLLHFPNKKHPAVASGHSVWLHTISMR